MKWLLVVISVMIVAWTLHDSEPAVVLLVLRWIVGAFR